MFRLRRKSGSRLFAFSENVGTTGTNHYYLTSTFTESRCSAFGGNRDPDFSLSAKTSGLRGQIITTLHLLLLSPDVPPSAEIGIPTFRFQRKRRDYGDKSLLPYIYFY